MAPPRIGVDGEEQHLTKVYEEGGPVVLAPEAFGIDDSHDGLYSNKTQITITFHGFKDPLGQDLDLNDAFLMNGDSIMDIGATFTLADVEAGRIRVVYNLPEVPTEGRVIHFDFMVDDGSGLVDFSRDRQGTPEVHEFLIKIARNNDAPTLGALPEPVAEGGTPAGYINHIGAADERLVIEPDDGRFLTIKGSENLKVNDIDSAPQHPHLHPDLGARPGRRPPGARFGQRQL